MRSTIGLAASGPWGVLPHPLPLGAPRRLAPDNETVLFNPNSAAGVSDSVNAEWVEHVTSVLSERYVSTSILYHKSGDTHLRFQSHP